MCVPLFVAITLVRSDPAALYENQRRMEMQWRRHGENLVQQCRDTGHD